MANVAPRWASPFYPFTHFEALCLVTYWEVKMTFGMAAVSFSLSMELLGVHVNLRN
jgi:hypothetical protein